MQIFVPTTATLAANVLNLMGYETSMSFISNDPTYGSMPILKISDSQGRSVGFGIAWPCAGVESLLLYSVTILLFLKKTNIPWKHRIIYFTIGAVVTYFINVLRVVTLFVIGINTGGAIIPILLSIYLIIKKKLDLKKVVVAIIVVTIITYIVTYPKPSSGIVSNYPWFLLPAIFASIASAFLLWKNFRKAAPLAYVAGTIGVLVGADVFHLYERR